MFGKSRRYLVCAAASVGSLGLILAPGAKSLGQDRAYEERLITAFQEQQKSAAAMRLARERYQFLHRVSHASAAGTVLDGGGFFRTSVLFPFGRADRVYLLLWNDTWPKPDGGEYDPISAIFCYQHLGGKDKLVYRVRFDTVNHGEKNYWPGAKQPFSSCVKNYVVTHNVPFLGKISKYAKNDIEAVRDYVYYDYQGAVGTLEIMPFSDYLGERNYNNIESFLTSRDPLTQKELKWGEFYQKYGLPVSFKEWAALKSADAGSQPASQ